MCIYYVGIDPSLTGCAYIVLEECENNEIKIVKKGLISTSAKDNIEDRFNKILKELEFIKNIQRLGNVYIEGLSFQSKGQSITELAGLHYLIRLMLFNSNTNYEIIEPTKLKKYITGKGQCKKNLMLLNIYKKFGIEFTDDNEGDAYCLARMALEMSKV